MFTKVAHCFARLRSPIAIAAALILALAIGIWIEFSIRAEQIASLSADREPAFFEEVLTLQAKHLGDATYDLVLQNQMDKKPVFAIVRDEGGGEYVVIISETGELSVRSVKSFLERGLFFP